MANGSGTSMHESASVWMAASAVLGVLGLALVGFTAGKVVKPDVNPVVLALFAFGCLVVLAAIASLFWGLVLFVAAKQPPRSPGPPVKAHRPSAPASPAAVVSPASAPAPHSPADESEAKGVPEKPNAQLPKGPDELTGVSADDLIKIRKENTACTLRPC